MSEKNLQKALIYLYANIDRYSSYSEAIFEQFALSSSEKQSLRELMTWQRDGLLLFNRQLRNKRRRHIQHALPRSQAIASRELETLLDGYASHPVPEGVWRPADAIRSFADYASAQVEPDAEVSKELEFIRFEAVFASVSLPPASTGFDMPRPLKLSAEMRLSLAGDAALLACSYDVLAAMQNPSLLGVCERFSKPHWFFLFQVRDGTVRILTVSPKLARAIEMFQRGLSLGEVLREFASDIEKTAASASIERLLSMEAPFFLKGPTVDRLRHPTKCLPDER